jgi:hypothetical protein
MCLQTGVSRDLTWPKLSALALAGFWQAKAGASRPSQARTTLRFLELLNLSDPLHLFSFCSLPVTASPKLLTDICIYTNIITCNNCINESAQILHSTWSNMASRNVQPRIYTYVRNWFFWYAWRIMAKPWYMNQSCDMLRGMWQGQDHVRDRCYVILDYKALIFNLKYNHVLLYYSNTCSNRSL